MLPVKGVKAVSELVNEQSTNAVESSDPPKFNAAYAHHKSVKIKVSPFFLLIYKPLELQ